MSLKTLITAALACIGVGCASIPNEVEGGQPRPKHSLELEQTVSDDLSQTRFRLGEKEGLDYFRVLHTETEAGTETLAGARVPVDSPYLKGDVELFTQTTPDNDAIGVNADGEIPALDDMIVGVAVERDAQAAETRHLVATYVGKEFENGLTVKAGIADVDGEPEYSAHAHRLSGRNFLGGALALDEEGKGRLTIASGRIYDGERGNGFGYRAWASTDFEKGHLVDAIFTTNTTFSKGSMLAHINLVDAVHDQSTVPNALDYVPGHPTPLDERIDRGGLAVRAKYVHTEAGETGLLGVRYNFPGESYPMLGLDLETDNPDTGDTTQAVTPMAGMRWKNARLDYACRMQEGEKPVHTGMVTMQVDF